MGHPKITMSDFASMQMDTSVAAYSVLHLAVVSSLVSVVGKRVVPLKIADLVVFTVGVMSVDDSGLEA